MEPIAGDHLNGNTTAHFSDNDASTSTDSEDNDPCQHSCHGHTTCVSGQLIAISEKIISQQIPFYDLRITSLALAPPTPPPTV